MCQYIFNELNIIFVYIQTIVKNNYNETDFI